jgi:hypothetical protein
MRASATSGSLVRKSVVAISGSTGTSSSLSCSMMGSSLWASSVLVMLTSFGSVGWCVTGRVCSARA